MIQPVHFTFDLVSEPWIPCERLDGTRVELGIRDTLAGAQELAAVSDESPLVTAVLYRLLLAVLDRTLQLGDRDAWLAFWRAERLPMEAIDEYLGRWRHRLDLFHPQRPFMQVAGLEARLTAERGEAPPRERAQTLNVERSQYAADVHLFEPCPAETGMSPASAARSLLAFHAYAAGGKIKNETESWTEGALRSGAVVIVRADDLRRTLLLNTTFRRHRVAADVPPWERDREIQRLPRRSVVGPIDQLVWPSRRVQLIPNTDEGGRILVREAVTAAGERIDGADAKVEDPQFSYFIGDKAMAPFPAKFRVTKAMWRDSTALFDGSKNANVHRRAQALAQLAELAADRIVPREARFTCELLGLSGKPANTIVYFWARERWPVPPSLLLDADRVSVLREGVAKAEAVGDGLDGKALVVLCARALSVGERNPHPKDVRSLRDSLGATAAYWSELGHKFESWLALLGACEIAEDALAVWKDSIRDAAERAFRGAVRKLGTTARAFQAVTAGEQALRRSLFEHLGARRKATTATPETKLA